MLCQPNTPAAEWAAFSGFDWSAGTVCRALIVAQGYPNTGRPLVGPANDAQAVAACLQQMETRPYSVTTETNLTVSGILGAIASAFGGASANDISLFYYSGHGDEGGCLVGQDMALLRPDALRSALDQIPGRKIVIVDACFSGGLLSDAKGGGDSGRKQADPVSFSQSFASAFYSASRSLTGSAYFVMASCQQTEECEEGYIRSGSVGKDMGYFTFALCLGCGWDGARSAATSMFADENGDNAVTLAEANIYADTLASLYNPDQSAVVYPAQCNWFAPFRK